MSRAAGCSLVTSRPSIRIRPAVTFSRPPIERSRVVLPHPEGPTSTTNFPSSIVRLTSSTARTSVPNIFETFSRTISPTSRKVPRSCNRYHMRRVEVAPEVACFRDTCNVYVLRTGREAVLIDFGSGAVLDHLGELGVERVTDVLVTHHHRDQVQGLARARQEGIRIWVPPHERELIDDVDVRWERRPLDNDYDPRQDRFSLLEQVAVDGNVLEYRIARYGHLDAYALPTPGHTVGSVTYLVELDGRRLAFSGDLVHGEGRVWSLAATQWSYSGIDGLAATFFSCGVLARREPDVLLPAHGDPVEEPAPTLEQARARLGELAALRLEEPWRLTDMQAHPWATITPHLLRNRVGFANSFALLSETGAALLLDFGFDLATGLVPVHERTSSRPLLWAIDELKRSHGVVRIEAVLPTHYHDDHVAGLTLIRDVEAAEVWSPENVAP